MVGQIMRSLAAIAAGSLLALCSVAVTSALAQVPAMTLGAGMHLIQAEVANTNESRMQGLMYRKSLGVNNGMLFVFTEDERHCMWMKNTFVPLSVAFIDAKGRIVSIHDMEPQTEISHCATGPARFALEMNKGWFKSKGIAPGAQLRGIEKAPPPR
jgi:uncharacterized membrane protein (UPF0127 family)